MILEIHFRFVALSPPPSAHLRVSTPFHLPDTLQATQPAHTVLGKLLHSGLQLGLGQVEIVHGADAQDACSREPRADAVHERPARGAEVVGHGSVQADAVVLAPGLEVVLAAQVLQVGVGDDEVGGEHGGGDFAAVGAVADEGVDEAGG